MTPQPAPLSAVQLDDLLLDNLGSAIPSLATALVDDEFTKLALAWRAELESVTADDLVDLETAQAVIAHATRTWWHTTGIRATVLLLAVIAAVALVLTVLERGAA